MNPSEYDSCCRRCGGPLQVLDASRPATVTCAECADTYDLDTTDATDALAVPESPARQPRRKKAVPHDA